MYLSKLVHFIASASWERRRQAPSFLLPSLITAALLLGLLPAKSASAQSPAIADSGIAVTTTLYLPSLNKRTPPCFTQAEPSIYGIQMYGDTGSQGDYYQAMLDTKVDWIRVPIPWVKVEPENRNPAKYWWPSADAAVNAAIDGCKHVIITHQTAPDWAAEYPESVINGKNLGDFEDYIGALAERYNGDGYNDAPGSPVVLYWEMYNEPDATSTRLGLEGWGEYPQEYTQMLKQASRAIKEANPDAQILMGGLAYDWFQPNGPFVRSFLDGVLAAGADNYFDIFNFHAYPGFGETWIKEMNPDCVKTKSCHGPGLLEKAMYMQQKLEANDLVNTPVIITESGWYSERDFDLPSTPEVQARYVTELSVQSKAAGVKAMIEFSLVDPQQSAHEYGILKRNGQAKLAYVAYTTVISRLSNATYIRRLTADETDDRDLDAYMFRNPSGNTFYVAWLNPAELGIDLDGDGNPDTKDKTENLHVPGNEAKVYDIYNNYPPVTIIGKSGDLKIPVGAQPRYIVVTK